MSHVSFVMPDSHGNSESTSDAFAREQREWLASCFDAITDTLDVILPSTWAEDKRYLGPSVTSQPGPYRFDVAPYMREPLDCLSVESPVHEIYMMKGAQVTATTSILENGLGYFIEHICTAPMMLVTADAELAHLRMESYVTPMLQSSRLMHLIKSSDDGNARKTGKTDKKLEWVGGGFLVPLGAKNAAKFRSTSARVLFCDEVDGWPEYIGSDGDPTTLLFARTNGYEQSRKIVGLSTPLIKGQSMIDQLYKRGDQRKYMVRCLRCEFPQELRWEYIDKETGVVSGFTWEMNGDRIVPGSTRYLCAACTHPHTEDDKPRLFKVGNAQWVPTAEPIAPDIRSYHLPALYSPYGMQSWGACAQMWINAWDTERRAPKDSGKLQVFYNNVLGVPYEMHGDKVKFESVSSHRRHSYHYGTIPNTFAREHCEGPVLLVTCAVDVHKESLKVATFGWTRGRRGFLIEYHNFEGNCENLDDADTWMRLRSLIEGDGYLSDDGCRYRPQLTLVDSGYLTSHVYEFCDGYQAGVFPVKGASHSAKSVRVPEFSEFKTPNGGLVFGITVDLYKDRWAAALRRQWSGVGVQPEGHFNAPIDSTDAQLRELTGEIKSAKKDRVSGKIIGFEWHRFAANELWDLLIYNNAALDLVAWNYCKGKGLDNTSWRDFWDDCEKHKIFFTG